MSAVGIVYLGNMGGRRLILTKRVRDFMEKVSWNQVLEMQWEYAKIKL